MIQCMCVHVYITFESRKSLVDVFYVCMIECVHEQVPQQTLKTQTKFV